MTFRVVQWATGNLGRAAIQGVRSHPELELVGCWVHSAEKVGRDAGELAGDDPIGVAATDDAEALIALAPDCVLYSPIMAQPGEVARLLEAGINVVTPLDWFYPRRASDVGVMEAAARKGGVTLHGTGIHPGGITERIPLMLSAFSREVTHVRAEEFSDIRAYMAEGVVKEIMLFGKPPEVAAKSPMLQILGGGFGQSIDMIADALDVTLDPERTTRHEMAVATQPIETPVGVLDRGTVAAQRLTWEGTIDGEPFVTVRVNWLMGTEHLEPAWDFGPEGERFEVEVQGDPSLRTSFHGLHPHDLEAAQRRNPGMVATAMHCVNAIPYVCRAEPGIRTYLDLPLVAGRAAGALRR
ncbi:MAG: dihydrodipicolinate reductase [Myxococcales bacterium]|nr:dihydrodipicolinate reductase [Myxococcales bacterium]